MSDCDDLLDSPITGYNKTELPTLPIRGRFRRVMGSRLECALAEGFGKKLIGWVIYVNQLGQYIL
jgi:hypothetical protein